MMKTTDNFVSFLSAELKRLEQELKNARKELSAERKEKEKISFDLQECNKALHCHNQLSLIFSSASMAYKETIKNILEIIPASWHFHELAEAMIEIEGVEYKTPDYRKSNIEMSEPVIISEKVIGKVVVGYPNAKFKEGTQIWLPEETELLRSISERIGNYWIKIEHGKRASQNERMFTSMLDSLPDSILITNLAGKIIYFSPRSPQVLGFKHDSDLTGHSIFEFLHDKEHTRAAKLIEDMFSNQNSGATEYVGVRDDGTPFEIEINGELIHDEDGQVVNMIFVTRDISERKKIEQDLLESERRLSMMMQNLPGVAYRCLKNARRTMLFISEGCFDLTGYIPEVFGGENSKPYYSIIHPDDRESVAKAVEEAVKRREPFEIEYRIITAGSETKYVWEKGQGIYEKGKLVYLEGLINDITAKQHLLNELNISEQKYRHLINSVNDVFYEIDGNGEFTFVSPVSEHIFGYLPEELLGTRLFDYVYPEDLPVIEKAFKENLNHSYDYLEYRVYNKAGEVCWIRSSTTPFIENGKITGGSGSLQNITERKLAEIKLQQSEEKYRLLIQHSEDPIFMLEGDRFIEANPAALKFFGFQNEKEIAGIHPWDISPEFQPDGKLSKTKGGRVIKKAYKNGYNRFEWVHINKSGEHRWMDVALTYFPGPGTNKVYALCRDIKESKNLELALTESQREHQQAQELAKFGHWKLDLKNDIIEWSDEIYRIFEIDIEECNISYEILLNIVHPDDREKVDNAFQKSLLDKIPYDINHRLLMQDGRIKYVNEKCQTTFDIDGNPVSSLRTVMDITSQVELEQIIREKEERLTQIMEQSQTVIWETDVNGLYTYINPMAEKIWGYKPEELVGKVHYFDLHPEEHRRDFIQTTRQVFLKKKSFNDLINPVVRKDGNVITVLTNGIPILDAQKNLIGYRGADNDVTEKLKAEKQLKESELKYRNIFENIQDVYYESSLNGTILEISPSILKVSKGQFTREDLIGKSVFGFYADSKVRDQVIHTISQYSNIKDFEFDMINREGSVIPVAITAVLQKDDNGNPVRIVGNLRDVTQQKEAERSLRDSEMMYRSMFRDNKSVMYMMDPEDGRIVDVNQVATEFYGWSHEELCQMKISDINVLPEENVKQRIQEVLDIKNTKFNFQHRLANSEIRDVEVFSGPVKSAGKLLFQNIVHDVTDRNRALADLKKSEEALNASQKIAQMGSWDFNVNTYETVWSNNFYHMVGLHPEGVDDPYRQFLSLVHPDEKHIITDVITEVSATGKSVQNEMRFILPNNEIIWIQNRISPEFTNGKLEKLRGVFIDITKKKETERLVLEQNERLNAVLTSIPDLIFVVDREGNYLEYYCSEKENLFISKEQILDSSIRDRFPGRESAFHLNKLEKCFKTGKQVVFDYSVKADEQESFYESRINKMGSNRAIIISRNVTEKRIREREIRKLSMAVQQSPAMTIITDLEGTIEYVNTAFEKITGYSYNEIAGKSVLLQLSEAKGTKAYNKLVKAIRSGKSWRGEWQSRKKNGELYWEDISVMPFKDEQGKISKYLTVKLDITERKAAEQKVLELNADLERKVGERTSELNDLNQRLLYQIEEHVKVLRELRWNKTLLESMSNSSPLGFLVIDSKTENILYLNKRFCQIWKMPQFEKHFQGGKLKKSEVISHSKKMITHPKVFYQKVRDMLDKSNYAVLESEIELKDGRTLKRFTSPLFGEKGECYGRLFIYEDVSEQKRVSKLIEQSKQNYETFFNTTDDFLFVANREGKLVHVNETVINRLGYTKDEIIGQPTLFAHSEETKERNEKIFQEILAGTCTYSDLPLVTKTGEIIPVESNIKSGFWNGEPILFRIAKDISQIKLSEDKFSKAFHTSAALMAISDTKTNQITEVNNTWLNVLGFKRKEVIGKTPGELNIISFSKIRHAVEQRTKENGSVRDVEVHLTTKQGDERIGLFSTENIVIGQEASALMVIVDITDRKRMETEILKARNEAEKANEAKSEFLSRMSHELRTPMNSILGFSQLLERSDLTSKQMKAAIHIRRSGNHLLDLINEVLDISRIEAGRMQLSLEPVALPVIIRQVIDLVNPQAVEKKIEIETVPGPGAFEHIIADVQRIKQVMLNLVINAIKYNKTGGKVKVEFVRLNNKPEPTTRIMVSDTGVGIREEDIPKLFTPFERIGAENSTTEGTGLGLSVTKKIVEAMNGKVGVDSISGNGSTFWVEFPACDKHDTGNKLSVRKKDRDSDSKMVRGTIVYVEDNPSNIELIDEILEDYRPGISLRSVNDGNNAVEFILDSKADLVILDLNLPGMNGDKILRLLRNEEQTKNIPVIVISADAMPSKIEKLMTMGADNYLTKPIDVIVFLEVVDKFLKK